MRQEVRRDYFQQLSPANFQKMMMATHSLMKQHAAQARQTPERSQRIGQFNSKMDIETPEKQPMRRYRGIAQNPPMTSHMGSSQVLRNGKRDLMQNIQNFNSQFENVFHALKISEPRYRG